MRLLKCLLIICCFVFLHDAEAKKRCKPLLDKLHNIQAMQRNGYSSKRGLSLRDREDKARETWWNCETGRSNKKSKQKKVNKRQKNTKSNRVSPLSYKEIKAGTPFKTSNAIVMKSIYEGDKKHAWLNFYQQPEQCLRPKSLSEFAFCSENKLKQRATFEEQYNE